MDSSHQEYKNLSLQESLNIIVLSYMYTNFYLYHFHINFYIIEERWSLLLNQTYMYMSRQNLHVHKIISEKTERGGE